MIDRDREAQRFGAAGDLEGVDADHLSVAVQQRAAAVARIDGRIGLQHHGRARPANRAHDAARDGVLEDPERQPDGDHFLAGPHVVDGSERQYWLRRGAAVDAHDRQIEILRDRFNPARQRRAGGKTNRHRRVVGHDMAVGDDGLRRREESTAASLARLDRDNRR